MGARMLSGVRALGEDPWSGICLLATGFYRLCAAATSYENVFFREPNLARPSLPWKGADIQVVLGRGGPAGGRNWEDQWESLIRMAQMPERTLLEKRRIRQVHMYAEVVEKREQQRAARGLNLTKSDG